LLSAEANTGLPTVIVLPASILLPNIVIVLGDTGCESITAREVSVSKIVAAGPAGFSTGDRLRNVEGLLDCCFVVGMFTGTEEVMMSFLRN